MHKEVDINSNAIGKAIMEKHGFKINALLRDAIALADAPSIPYDERKERVIDIAQKLSDIVTPETPCKNGCSHCCYMATGVSRFEAEMISRFTGRALATQGSIEAFLQAEGNVAKYAGVACTFLKEGKCSIYPVRPLACRIHHNLALTADNCKVTPNLAVALCTDRLNFSVVDYVYVDLVISSGDAFADIREFFPSEA